MTCFETWFVTLRRQYLLSVFENRVVRNAVGPKMEEVALGRKNCIMRGIMYVLHLILLLGQ